jgi:hypothetical protein
MVRPTPETFAGSPAPTARSCRSWTILACPQPFPKGDFLPSSGPHFDQYPPLYPTALIALYLLIRTLGGQPEDATAIAALAGALLPQIRL